MIVRRKQTDISHICELNSTFRENKTEQHSNFTCLADGRVYPSLDHSIFLGQCRGRRNDPIASGLNGIIWDMC